MICKLAWPGVLLCQKISSRKPAESSGQRGERCFCILSELRQLRSLLQPKSVFRLALCSLRTSFGRRVSPSLFNSTPSGAASHLEVRSRKSGGALRVRRVGTSARISAFSSGRRPKSWVCPCTLARFFPWDSRKVRCFPYGLPAFLASVPGQRHLSI